MAVCNHDQLALYHDGELGLPDRIELERHLPRCEACRAELESMRRVDRVLTEWGAAQVAIPMATERRITSTIERRTRLATVLRFSRMVPAALGTTIAALLVLVSANQGWMTMRSAPPSKTNISHIIAKQSVPLSNARRVSALLPGHDTTAPTRRFHPTQQLDIE